MSLIYAVSDIHGFYDEMIETLSLVDLNSDKNNQLIFLGDYVNRGPKSAEVLYKIKELDNRFPGQVVVLMGNHDQMFLEWWKEDLYEWLEADQELKTVRSFFTEEQWQLIICKVQSVKNLKQEMNHILRNEILKNHQELIKWLNTKKKCLYYETKNQIFVHAGICEDDEELWKYATEPNEFTWKYPPETGLFFKDIIAGHTSSVHVSNDENNLGKIYWDLENHYFIDGAIQESGNIPLLKYDTDTKVYTSYEKNISGEWTEYKITKSKTKK